MAASNSGPRPPSVDKLARLIAASIDLPHALCVDVARQAIGDGPDSYQTEAAIDRARQLKRSMLGPVINATGVLLHTNLGRAPVAMRHDATALNIEFSLATGERGSRQQAVGQLFAKLCGAESAMVVNNNAAAVLLVVAALAYNRQVLVSRGESVEIGGSFRVPEVMEQSGAELVDVGTTNRTRLADYRKALQRPGSNVAMTLKVHPSNYRVEGFVEETPIAQLASLDVPCVADIGSGLLDAACPWLSGPPPSWLAGEPAARQAISDGAALITFSGDKLLGGPQAGIIAGRADLVAACARHPLARALRPGSHVLLALQDTALAYFDKTVVQRVPFWSMVAMPIEQLQQRAATIAEAVGGGTVAPVATAAVPGAGSAPGVTIPSFGISIGGDQLATLRQHAVPIIARTKDGCTLLDLRTVNPDDDSAVIAALQAL